MADLVEHIKPIDSFFDRLSDRQQTVVAKQCGLLVAQSLRNVTAFIFSKYNALSVKDDMILVLC